MEKEKKYLTEDEVKKIDETLYKELEEYISEEIANWTEMCECDAEGDALDFALSSECPVWRVCNDGTVDVVIHGDSREDFDFDWENEEGEEMTSNALDLLRGYVSHEFDDDCNNDLDDDLAERVVELFK